MGARRGVRGRVASAASLAILTIVACGPSSEQEEGAPRPARKPALNAILISIDSLRADHLGCYGYERDTSPAMDALAESGLLFERATAQAPWTLPSHASLLCSQYPRTHQVTAMDRRLAPSATTLADALKAAGYETHAIVSGPFMQARFGMDSGFDTYDDEMAAGDHDESHRAVTSPQIHERAIGVLDRVSEPFFLFLHYWDAHYDYAPPDPWDRKFDPAYEGQLDASGFAHNEAIHAGMDPRDLEHLIALYDGEIAWVDHHIGLLLEELERRELSERTVVVLTADHGDEFFEHGEKGHAHSLYEELLHVPLILRMPGGQSGKRVADRIQLVDVMPAILDALDVKAPVGMQGRSPLPRLEGAPHGIRTYLSETTRARRKKARGNRMHLAECAFMGSHKVIHYASPRRPDEIFDLAADPGELHDLSGDPALAYLLDLFSSCWSTVPEGTPTSSEGLDEATLERLDGLGYTGD